MQNEIYDAPQSDLGEIEKTKDGIATRWSRFWAAMFDGLTIAPLSYGLMYLTGGFEVFSTGVQPSFYYTLGISVFGVCIFIAMHGYYLVKNGQTLGKKLLSIRIVRMDDEKASVAILLQRYFFNWFLPIIPVAGPILSTVSILLIFTKAKRCGHDYVAGTKVVRVDEESSPIDKPDEL